MTPQVLTLRIELLGLHWTREFARDKIQFLRVGNYGPLAFDYGSKTYHFGMSIYEAEAYGLMDRINAAWKRW